VLVRAVVVFMLAVATAACGLVTGLKVEPVKATWSGKADPEDGVWQSITCNFDEPIYTEYFTGTATGQQYQVQLQLPGIGGFVVATGDTYDSRGHKWIRCYFKNIVTDSIIKGRTYWVKWTLSSGSDSLAFYYDSTDQYRYGCLTAPPLVYNNGDLACRVYGVLDTIDVHQWGATSFLPSPWDCPRRGMWVDKMKEARAGCGTFYIYWNDCETQPYQFNFYDQDAHVRNIAESAGMEPIAVLIGTPRWASTRVDSHWLADSQRYCYDTAVYCAPRNLVPAQCSTNYWSRYLDSLIHHVDLWERDYGSRRVWHLDCPRFAGHFFRRHLLALRTQLG
jgi:hypothetical protein